MFRPLRTLLWAAVFLAGLSHSSLAQQPTGTDTSEAYDLVWTTVNSNTIEAIDLLEKIRERGNPDVAFALVDLWRFFPAVKHQIRETLVAVTGENPGWSHEAWVEWVQRTPGLIPFPDYDRFKSDLFAKIDKDFRLFVYPGFKREIRLAEIAWGGVRKDGIPALTNPELIDPAEAEYLQEDELVFGVEINGDARAYPFRFMDWHEMFNDVIGGVPVSLAYCTLCGSGILYETTVDGWDSPFVFGSSGFLYRSNKLMYDTGTHSLWNQFTGRPVTGELAGSGIELKVRPVTITTWQDWYARHPHSRVLSRFTGYDRDYTPGRPYGAYFASDTLMFPVHVADTALPVKAYVFAVRDAAVEKAWPLDAFEEEPVINDRVGKTRMVLIGEPESRTVRAYEAGGQMFQRLAGGAAAPRLVDAQGRAWAVTEAALKGPGGLVLKRIPGHIGYWFAWRNFNPNAEVYARDG